MGLENCDAIAPGLLGGVLRLIGALN